MQCMSSGKDLFKSRRADSTQLQCCDQSFVVSNNDDVCISDKIASSPEHVYRAGGYDVANVLQNLSQRRGNMHYGIITVLFSGSEKGCLLC